jgi:putative ABC transport system permease protein
MRTRVAPPLLLILQLPGTRTPPLALRNVVHGGFRSLLAIAGVAFSITLVLLQLGFLEAVRITATTVFDQLEFDVALLSPEYEQFFGPGSFPIGRLKEAQSEPGVIDARPLYARMAFWRCPPYPVESPEGSGSADAGASPPIEDLGVLKRWWLGSRRPRPLQLRELLVLGVDPERNPFRPPIRDQIEAARPELRTRDRFLLNAWSSPDFGWDSHDAFSGWELNGRGIEVVGGFTLQRSFGADASVLGIDENFARVFQMPGVGLVNFGLLRVRPDAVAGVVRELNRRLPPDVQALSRADLVAREEDYWVRQTATGKIFAYGVLVTILVAAVVIYQVLANDIRDHITEYATLKAMGHTNASLSRVVVMQALIYSMAAYVPAVAAGAGLYRATESLANIPMRLTAANLGLVLVLTLGASFISALLTLNKVRSAEPAELF